MALKLFSENDTSRWRILIAAQYSGVEVSTVSDKSLLSKSPVGKAPVLETKQGVLFESNAIARYIAKLGKNKLYGSDAFEAAQVEQWIDFAVHEIELPGAVWVYPIQGKIPNNPTATQRAKGDIKKALETLNKHLLHSMYLVGHRITLADIVVASTLYYLYELVLDPNFRKPFQNTNRWYTTLINQPEFKAVLGQVKLCEEMKVAPENFVPPQKTQESQPEKKPPKEKQPKQEKKQPKKEEKKPKEKEPEEAGLEEEEEEKKPKVKSALELLPPSPFVLDEWKRTYSNEDTRTKALPWFWENYDKDGYSIWFCDYKYNDENEKLFKTCNLVGGFIQRLDKLRKFGFGSLLIFGSEPRLEISGCWLFRGLDVPQEMKETDDYEHYTWRKANIDDPETRELINDFWAWDGKLGGKTLNQGKVFK